MEVPDEKKNNQEEHSRIQPRKYYIPTSINQRVRRVKKAQLDLVTRTHDSQAVKPIMGVRTVRNETLAQYDKSK